MSAWLAAQDSWMVSVDDHVIEPPNVWTDRLPAKYRAVGPRFVRDSEGPAWLYEDTRHAISHEVTGGPDGREKWTNLPVGFEEIHPACYEPRARIAAMNTDRVITSMLFPNFPRFCGQTFYEGKDKEQGLRCVKAYNDWLLEEWCAAYPGRFIGCMLIPLWDPRAAAKELERCAAAGARAFCFSENPHELGLPSIHDTDGYWDPVLRAANDTELVLCTHLGSSSVIPTTAPDAPVAIMATLLETNIMRAFCDWVFYENLSNYPRLKVFLSEGGIGWIPYMIERAEWMNAVQETLPYHSNTSPRQVFQDHLFGCFVEDPHGIRSIDEIGVDHIMFETDFPHLSTSWPNSAASAERQLAGLDEESCRKILRENAERLLRFKAPPAPANPELHAAVN